MDEVEAKTKEQMTRYGIIMMFGLRLEEMKLLILCGSVIHNDARDSLQICSALSKIHSRQRRQSIMSLTVSSRLQKGIQQWYFSTSRIVRLQNLRSFVSHELTRDLFNMEPHYVLAHCTAADHAINAEIDSLQK